MRTTILNTFLFVMVVTLLSLNWLLRADPGVRNYEVLPDMARSIPYDSFTVNANFRNGQTLQLPVAGTIVRGHMPLHYAATPADAIRAGRELVNPYKATDAAVLARGQAVYMTFCEICHGPAGKGDGPVAQRGFPAPPSLLAPKAMQIADGQMFHIVTYGQNNMPSYAAQIEREDRWKAIVYVRSLQRSKP